MLYDIPTPEKFAYFEKACENYYYTVDFRPDFGELTVLNCIFLIYLGDIFCQGNKLLFRCHVKEGKDGKAVDGSHLLHEFLKYSQSVKSDPDYYDVCFKYAAVNYLKEKFLPEK